jgi:uncharacterized protein YbaR (Trm112 family)
MPISSELLEILACPMCKGEVEYRSEEEFLLCERCNIRYYAKACNLERCRHCKGELKQIHGEVLLCRTCSRWYPIIEDIPHMLPDELREDLC